jgi:hypothetical protein
MPLYGAPRVTCCASLALLPEAQIKAARFRSQTEAKGPLLTAPSMAAAHLPRSLMFTWRRGSFKVSLEQRVALMKPLSATKIEVLQPSGRWTWKPQRSGSEPQHFGAGNQELHVHSSQRIFQARLMHSQRMRKLCSRWSRLVEESRPRQSELRPPSQRTRQCLGRPRTREASTTGALGDTAFL